MKIFYSLLLVLALGSTTLFAQNKLKNKPGLQEVYKSKADKDFESYKYASAINFYLLSDTTHTAVINNLATSYHNIKDYDNAEKWFAKAVELPALDDAVYLSYAEVLSNKKKYTLAEKWYAKYLSLHPNDRRAQNLSQLTKSQHRLLKDSLNWHIDYLSVNTPRDEFGPAYFKRGLIFSSNREKKWGISNIFGWNQTPFTDLYIIRDTAHINYLKPENYFYGSQTESSGVTQVKRQRMPQSINDTKVLGDITLPRTISNVSPVKDSSGVRIMRGSLNTRFHDGPVTFSSGQSYMIYNRNHKKTSNKEEKKKGIHKLNMYAVNYTGGTWHNKQPFVYNDLNFSTAHPALSPDNKVLYFVSDMPGGFGGKDIYYCTRENGSSEWSQPVNLGNAVNTEGDEVFPYVSSDNQLYFSSNGHAGLGGLDIFTVKLKNNLPASEIKNLGYPLNSSKDDFSIIMQADKSKGYFSSNRYGSDDIFRFKHQPLNINLEGQVLANYGNRKEVLGRVLVKLSYDGQTDSLYTDQAGRFFATLSTATDYTIEAEKKSFTKADTTLTTNGITKSTTLHTELVLLQSNQSQTGGHPVQPGLSDCELKKMFALENVYYDLDKSTIRPDAAKSLDRIASIMKQYPSVSLIATSHCDSRASKSYNIALSMRRSESSKSYLVRKGIDPKRIEAAWYGESRLTNECKDNVDCSEEKQQLNRRTEFQVIKEGKILSTLNCDN